jgi:hypothetical protein
MRKAAFPPWPVSEWPDADRAAWQASAIPGNPFEPGGAASEWAAVSRRVCERAYGSWLEWLQQNQLLDPQEPAGDRATRERLAQYAHDLGATVGQFTIQSQVQMVGNLLRVEQRIIAFRDDIGGKVSALIVALYQQKMTYGEFAQKRYEIGRDIAAAEREYRQAILMTDEQLAIQAQQVAQQNAQSTIVVWTTYVQTVNARQAHTIVHPSSSAARTKP